MRCPAIAQALRRAPRITFAPSKHFADGSGHLDVVVPGIGLEHLVVRNTGGGAIEVTFMVVTKQRAGAGTAAVRSLVAWAKGNGFTRMHLKANDSATGFWAKMGFVPDGPASPMGDLVPMVRMI